MSRGHGDTSIATPTYVRDSDLLGAALTVAARAHAGQRRNDGAPYLAHPLRVCELLAHAAEPETTLAAALLHDAVEDSDLTVGDVVERFGLEIGEIVAALTEDERIDDWVVRKDDLRERVAEAGPRAAAVYAADKLANLGEMCELYATHGESAIELHKAPSLDLRVEAWRRDLAMVAERAPDLSLVATLRDQLRRFELERAGRVTGQEASARG
jgi:guanosine-3',5'-bis(diphosphate) 3'-pyrophosphohydrolase